MTVNEILSEFTEKYDREFMEYVEDCASNIGIKYHKIGFDGFDIVRAIDQYKTFIENYSNYKISHINDDKATEQDIIVERVNNDIEEKLFVKDKIQYAKATSIIESYLQGLQDIDSTEESCKKKMFEAGVDHESIGDLTSFTQKFITKLNTIMESTMETFGKGSGYYSNKILLNPNTPKKQEEVFL